MENENSSKKQSKINKRIINTSASGSNTSLPDVFVKKFNWGAFAFIWGLFNILFPIIIGINAINNSLSHSIFVPDLTTKILLVIIGLIFGICIGTKANEWLGKRRRWESIEHFNEIQRVFAIYGWIFFVIYTVVALGVYNYIDTLGAIYNVK